MPIRFFLLASCLIVSAFAVAPAFASGFCGVGCHASPSGSCVRDGWEQALPVRNECPATSRPTPPCGRYYRWNRQNMSCEVRQ